jgi:tellurite resistance protein TehA-like permease
VAESARQRAQSAIAGLAPGYFALVMASGIISVGMKLKGFELISAGLLVVCIAGFVILFGLTVWRLIAYRRAIKKDLFDPARAFGFFTFVAGTNVLGVRLGMGGHHVATALLLAVAGVAWLLLGYVVPWTAVLGKVERPVVATANGTWFIWVVASQSVATAAATVEPAFVTGRRELAVLAVMSWSVGVFLYAGTAMIVSLRLLLYPIGPEELTPPYWVSMGALAITVVAGARIVEMADAPMVAVTRDLISGLSVVFWAFATWLIPVLLAASWWRHKVRHVPLRYEASLWSVVFPLGMYAVAGIFLGEADRLPLVAAIGSAELWFAFLAWSAVMIAMLDNLVRRVALPLRH